MNTYTKSFFLAVLAAFLLTSNAFAWDKKDDSNVPVTQTAKPVNPSYNEPQEDPFAEMEKMEEGFTELLRESWKRMKNYQQAGKFFEPDVDFVQQGNNYILRMDLPGMQKDQINIETTENAITVSGERHTERQASNSEGVSQFERSSGSFYRSMSLPANADTSQIAAKYENGVLEITIPKVAAEKMQKKKVKIQ